MATIEVIRGDIVTLDVDAIVNAANRALKGGGGVDGAIHRAAGPALKRASLALAPCPPGDARLTPGFALPARFVIHAVGPRWRGGHEGEATTLAAAYRASLDLAAAASTRTIAFPAISTGVYGFPKAEAARVARSEIRVWLEEHPGALDRILLVAHSDADEAALRAADQETSASTGVVPG